MSPMSVLSQAWWALGLGGPASASNPSIFHGGLVSPASVAFCHLGWRWLCDGAPGVTFWWSICEEGVAVIKPRK